MAASGWDSKEVGFSPVLFFPHYECKRPYPGIERIQHRCSVAWFEKWGWRKNLAYVA
jgi:hypothetical protein